MKAKPDGLWVFRERTSSRLKRRTPLGWLSLSFCGTPSHALPRSVFEKTPLGTLKNFFRFVKAKPDNLVGVSCRDFVPPEKAHPDGWLALSLWDAVPHPAKERF